MGGWRSTAVWSYLLLDTLTLQCVCTWNIFMVLLWFCIHSSVEPKVCGSLFLLSFSPWSDVSRFQCVKSSFAAATVVKAAVINVVLEDAVRLRFAFAIKVKRDFNSFVQSSHCCAEAALTVKGRIVLAAGAHDSLSEEDSVAAAESLDSVAIITSISSRRHVQCRIVSGHYCQDNADSWSHVMSGALFCRGSRAFGGGVFKSVRDCEYCVLKYNECRPLTQGRTSVIHMLHSCADLNLWPKIVLTTQSTPGSYTTCRGLTSSQRLQNEEQEHKRAFSMGDDCSGLCKAVTQSKKKKNRSHVLDCGEKLLPPE